MKEMEVSHAFWRILQILVCLLCLLQFKQNPHLEKALIDTFPRILAEATPRSPLWGIGLDLSDPLINNRNTCMAREELAWVLTDGRQESDHGREGDVYIGEQ